MNELTRIFDHKMACMRVEDLKPGYFLDKADNQQARGLVESVCMPVTESMKPVFGEYGGWKLCVALEGRQSPVIFCYGDLVVATDPDG